MVKLKVQEMGDTLVIEVPASLRHKYSLKKGDCLCAEDGPDGVLLSVRDSDFEELMHIAEEGMKKYQAALRELADL